MTNILTPVLFDFETCSWADLKEVGARNYAAHESTRVLIGCFLIDGVFNVWLPGQVPHLACWGHLWPEQFGPKRPVKYWTHAFYLPPDVRTAIRDGREFIAHNAFEFDEYIWREKVKDMYPPKFGDTLPRCRAAGLPGKLDELGEHFFGLGKDPGQVAMSKLWKLERDEEGMYVNKNHTQHGLIAAAARYCVADVIILEKVFKETLSFGEQNVVDCNRRINQRGIQFDAALARKLIKLSDDLAEEAGRRVEEITGGELTKKDLRSVTKVKRWLSTKGVSLDNLRKQTIEQILNDPDAFIASQLEEEFT